MNQDNVKRGQYNRARQTYRGTDVVRATWIDRPDVRRWLRQNLFTGRVLNFPCGRSGIGDVTADIDPSNDPDIVADLLDYPHNFGPFDTVYCDPPFSFYRQESHNWIKALWDITAERLILKTKNSAVYIPPADKSWYVAEPRQGTAGYAVKLYQVFDRLDESLERFRGGSE